MVAEVDDSRLVTMLPEARFATPDTGGLDRPDCDAGSDAAPAQRSIHGLLAQCAQQLQFIQLRDLGCIERRVRDHRYRSGRAPARIFARPYPAVPGQCSAARSSTISTPQRSACAAGL